MKPRISVWMLSAILAAYPAAADFGCPFAEGTGAGYGMMGGWGWFGGGLLWLLFVALAAFVFALVFWGTKKLLMGDTRQHTHHASKKK